MNDGEMTFAAEFPLATVDLWRTIVEKALKGAPFEKRLVTQLYEGIAVLTQVGARCWPGECV